MSSRPPDDDRTRIDPQHGGEGAGEPESPGSGPGRIGPYRLIELLGRGGMGTVYLAEQLEPVQRGVALKLIGITTVESHLRNLLTCQEIDAGGKPVFNA